MATASCVHHFLVTHVNKHDCCCYGDSLGFVSVFLFFSNTVFLDILTQQALSYRRKKKYVTALYNLPHLHHHHHKLSDSPFLCHIFSILFKA